MPWIFPLVAALAATGPTAHTVHPFGPDGLALEGVRDTASVELSVPAALGRDGPVEVELHWRATELAVPDRSTLTVRWRGLPLTSTTLEQLTRDGTPVPLTVALPESASGFGALTVDAHIALDGDPCETPPDGVWLAVDPTSTVRWQGTGGDAPDDVETLRDWLSTGVDPLAIALDPSAPDMVLAGLELDHHLRDLGRSTRPRAERTVHLLVGDLPPDAPDAAASLARLRPNGDLALWADSPEQLLAVVDAMGEGLDHRCALPTCWMPRQSPEGGTTSRPPQDPAKVATVADAGHARGWTTRGSGHRHLRLVWERPPHTELEPGAPRVRLDVDHVHRDRLDADRSAITATVNGRPVGTWSLTEPGVLEVPIPEDLLADDVWVLDLDATLWPTQDQRCRWLDPGDLWLVLGAESGLHVPRREAPSGLAAFAEAAPSALSWDPSDLDPRSRWALATATYSLPEPPDGWTAVRQGLCDQRRCLLVGAGDVLAVDGERWLDQRGDLAQPLLASTGAALQTDGDDVVLTVGSALEGLSPPRWASLHGPVALHDGASWSGLGRPEPGVAREIADRETIAGRVDDDTAGARAADLVFGLVFLLAVAGAAGWVWSGLRRGKPVEELELS